MENQKVSGGVISDYVKGKQSTAYANIWLDYTNANRIRCSVQCGRFFRCVQVSPMATLDCIVRQALDSSVGFSPSCEQVQNGLIVVDGKRWHPKTKASACIQYGSIITFTPTFCRFSSEDILGGYYQNLVPSNEEKKQSLHRIKVNITSSDYQVEYEISASVDNGNEIINGMKSYFSVRL